MEDELNCPKCHSENVYQDGSLWICPECSHEFTPPIKAASEVVIDATIRDAYGVELKEGDSVSVIKDLKVKGSSSTVKVGTKVKNIRLVESDNGHNIACKVDGIGAINLKQEFVKKV